MHQNQLAEGCFVQHDEFGLGKVISLEGPNAFVVFQHCGEKIITRSLLQVHAEVVVNRPDRNGVAWAAPRSNRVSNERLVSFSNGAYRSFRRSGRI